MKKTISLATIIILLLSLGTVTNGFSDYIEVYSIEKHKDSLRLTWKQISNAKKYVLYDKNGAVLYEGNEREFIHKNLVMGEMYEYVLAAFDKDDRLLTKMNIITNTLHPLSNDSVKVDMFLNERMIKIDWSDIPHIQNYTVYRDGEPIMIVSQSEFKDFNVSFGREYMYTIEGIEKVKKFDEAKGKVVEDEKNHVILIPLKQVIDKRNTHFQEFSKSFSTFAVDPVTSYRNTTFIKPAKISAPDGYCYGGDNRNFSASASTYRTRIDLSIYWRDGSYGFSKYTRDSIRYNKNDNGTCGSNELARQNAGTSGITAVKEWITPGEAQFQISHSVGLPFYMGAPPNIDYSYSLNIQKSGVTYISGSHDQYPWHEIYRSDNGGTWKTLYQFDPDVAGTNVNYLFPWYPNKKIAVGK
ncbi:hypothetical protein GHH_c13040 [Geobacillus sp. GHH01]|uniref:DUF3238 domain-containing protein n=1 Tax=Geobacillus sp. GHH01 TaxID=1233873 RepID=UPI0002AF3B2B|nr:DUF3238 domain-containing protein [Geobacillus sp. GHH01]AGE21841.1 hypothetical protein GHH_c13040 [Geobacillus sp. GHH01]KZM54055.1 hypothetical protein A3Q36_09005 [Geobacillus stearothermophilus]